MVPTESLGAAGGTKIPWKIGPRTNFFADQFSSDSLLFN